MRNNKILTIMIVLFLVAVVFAVVKFTVSSKGSLVSPGAGKTDSPSPTPMPTPANNPPKEIRYDSSTNLQKELEAIDPQVLDSDFEE